MSRVRRPPPMAPVGSTEAKARAAYNEFRYRSRPMIAPNWEEAPDWVRGLVAHLLQREPVTKPIVPPPSAFL